DYHDYPPPARCATSASGGYIEASLFRGFKFMAKEATRQAIIQKGAKLIHSRGFVNTGIQEIITAAGVPKGSFYFYFKNKDDFGASVIDHFSDLVISWFEK